MPDAQCAMPHLSEFAVRTKLGDIPQRTVEQTQRILLDTVGGMLAASAPRYSAGRILLEYTRALGGTPEALLVGSRERSSCVNAALYNGTLGYYCDVDAHHPGAIMHAAAIVVPTALAFAERQQSSGADLLAAITIGVDVACRTSLAIGPRAMYARGQHPTCVAGCFGAATAAGRLLGLEPEGMARAWGLTGTQASGLLAWEADDTENSRPFNPGIAARNGATAALLASFGFGAPPDVFQGKYNVLEAFGDTPNLEELTDRLGERFAIDELAIKRYACCAFLHPGLDGLADIMRETGIQARDIEAMRLRFPRSGAGVIDDNPLRSHCGQYILPIYALECQVVIDDILLDRRGEAAIAALSEKTDVLADDALDPEFPTRYTSIIEVDARSSTFSRNVTFAKGCPENPLDDADVEAKFRSLTAGVLDDAPQRDLIDRVRGIATATSIEALIDLLQIDRG